MTDSGVAAIAFIPAGESGTELGSKMNEQGDNEHDNRTRYYYNGESIWKQGLSINSYTKTINCYINDG